MTKSGSMDIKGRARVFWRFMRAGTIVLLWLATVMGFYYIYDWPKIVAVSIFLLLPLIGLSVRKKKVLAIGVIVLFLGMISVVGRIKPSNDRYWSSEFSVLPSIDVTRDQVSIQGFRSFRWHSLCTFDAVWEKRVFDLRKLTSLDLIVEPFKDSDLLAHTMLRFGFGEDGAVIVSVEARREEKEQYNLVAGALRQFELIYIFGDENDLLLVRAVHRGARLYIYPVKADQEFIVSLFRDLASSANALHEEPKFYRSLRDNCTTTLVKHIDRQPVEQIGFRYETVFPALTGRLLYRRGFMDTDLSYEQAREYFRADEAIRNK